MTPLYFYFGGSMRFCTIASSSSGNCTLVSEGSTNILIDAGISARRISTSLKELGICCSDISAVFITHEHSDHICGLKTMEKQFGIPVMAPEFVAKGIAGAIPEIECYIQTIPVGEELRIGELSLHAFRTPHDTDESVGYKITDGAKSFAIATDMGHVTEEVLRELIGVDAAVLEANHDAEMLKKGPYPYHLKKRILSDRGHLSNRLCGLLAGRLFEHGAKNIILAHLSKENNTPELAYNTVAEQMAKSGAVPGVNVGLYVAPKTEHGPIIEV